MDERRTSTFKIDAEIGGRAVRRLGLFRTTVGAILATAVFFALKAGLLQQITIPQGPRAIYFFLVVAFLAGFSERWAQIVLGGAEGVLTPMPQQQAAPSTDGAPPHITGTPGNRHRPHHLGGRAGTVRDVTADVTEVEDRLYGADLDEFVKERAAAAKELRSERRRDDAAVVAKLAKPSVAAWIVNRVARDSPGS